MFKQPTKQCPMPASQPPDFSLLSASSCRSTAHDTRPTPFISSILSPKWNSAHNWISIIILWNDIAPYNRHQSSHGGRLLYAAVAAAASAEFDNLPRPYSLRSSVSYDALLFMGHAFYQPHCCWCCCCLAAYYILSIFLPSWPPPGSSYLFILCVNSLNIISHNSQQITATATIMVMDMTRLRAPNIPHQHNMQSAFNSPPCPIQSWLESSHQISQRAFIIIIPSKHSYRVNSKPQ